MAPKKKLAPKKTRKKASKGKPAVKLSPMGRDERYLTILIQASERAIDNNGSDVDELFRQQANRLKLELKQLKGKK